MGKVGHAKKSTKEKRSWVELILFSIMITLGLEMVGAAMHTVISAAFNEVPVNYVWKRWEVFSLLHVVLRGLVAVAVLKYLRMVADANEFQLKYAALVVIGCAILLAVLDFVTYVMEYFTLAMWKAITSLGETVTLKNVIRCKFLRAVDLVNWLCQGFVALLAWWIRTKKREKKAQVRDLSTAKEQLVAENKQLATANEQLAIANEQLVAANKRCAATNARLRRRNKAQSEKIENLTSELEKRVEKTIMLPPPRE